MKRHRSPAYPAVSLKPAIEKAQLLYDRDGRTKVPVRVATQHLGYTVGSGIGLRTIAALGHFGLLGASGKRDSRQVWLSERALDIVLAPHSEDQRRRSAIRDAALAPEIHGDVWEFFHGVLPSDDTLQSYLVRDREFHDAHVQKVIEEIRATFSFAQLTAVGPADHVNDTQRSVNAVAETKNGAENRGRASGPQDKHGPRSSPPPQVLRGAKQAVYPLTQGDVILQWPESISAEEVADLEDWLELMKRKLKRSAVGYDDDGSNAR